MKRLFLFLFISTVLGAGAQSVSEEWGVDIFFSGYQGEVVTGYSSSSLFKELRPGLGLLYRWNIKGRHSIGIEGKYVQLYASAKNHDAEASDIEFKTTILEGDLAYYYRFMDIGTGWGNKHMTPYAGVGAGLMYVTPSVEFTGAAPPGLNESAHNSTNVFYELGVTYQTQNYMRLGLYWGHQKTFTDYLDGFRISSSSSDWYYSIGITITGMFYRQKESCYY